MYFRTLAIPFQTASDHGKTSGLENAISSSVTKLLERNLTHFVELRSTSGTNLMTYRNSSKSGLLTHVHNKIKNTRDFEQRPNDCTEQTHLWARLVRSL